MDLERRLGNGIAAVSKQHAGALAADFMRAVLLHTQTADLLKQETSRITAVTGFPETVRQLMRPDMKHAQLEK